MNLWLQLGLGGAALFLLYVFITKLFAYLENKGTSEKVSDTKVDRLFDKIEKMVEAIYAVNQTNEVTKNQLGLQYDMLLEINDKVTGIDMRTKLCIPDRKEVA
jgi:hypothetical protein